MHNIGGAFSKTETTMFKKLILISNNMKSQTFALALVIIAGQSSCAQIVDPIAHFRNTSNEPSAKLVKWTADINGDGKPEVFLANKEDYDASVAADVPVGWFVFVASQNEGTYAESTGIQEAGEDSIGVGGLPRVNLKACFVGQVSELGKSALLTEQIDNPRVGNPIARIYAYTIEGDHLKRTKLAEYDATKENPLFDKYLNDGKRTVITPVEINS